MRNMTLLARFLNFRTELVTLWRAFRAPETPFHLKALMLLVPLYLVWFARKLGPAQIRYVEWASLDIGP